MEKAKSMQIDSEAQKAFWFEVVNTTNYLVNKTTTKANLGKSLEELFTNHKPTLQHLRIFS